MTAPQSIAFFPAVADFAGLPLGLQLMGFAEEDSGLFATAATVRDLLGAMR